MWLLLRVRITKDVECAFYSTADIQTYTVWFLKVPMVPWVPVVPMVPQVPVVSMIPVVP